MSEIFIENLTAKPVWVRLNSGDQLNVYPRTHSVPVPNSEIENNERVKKLVDLAAIRLHRGFVEEKQKEVTVQTLLSNPPLHQEEAPKKSKKHEKTTAEKTQEPKSAPSNPQGGKEASIENNGLLQKQMSPNLTASDGGTQ